MDLAAEAWTASTDGDLIPGWYGAIAFFVSEEDLEGRNAFPNLTTGIGQASTLSPRCFGKELEGSFPFLVQSLQSMIKKKVYTALVLQPSLELVP